MTFSVVARCPRTGKCGVAADHEEYPQWDIRVDDHEEPVKELRRLFHLFQDKLLSHMNALPTRKDYPKIVG